jgi:hypothetical protein
MLCWLNRWDIVLLWNLTLLLVVVQLLLLRPLLSLLRLVWSLVRRRHLVQHRLGCVHLPTSRAIERDFGLYIYLGVGSSERSGCGNA